MAVACVLRIVRGQDADVAGPYLAARRACRSADRRLGDPGGRAAEAGRLWLHPLFAADVPGSVGATRLAGIWPRSEEHTCELQSLMRISYAVLCLKKTKQKIIHK